jgi:hypothetical protein
LREALAAGLTPRLARGERVSFVTLTAPALDDAGSAATAFANLVRVLRGDGVEVEYCGVVARGVKSGLIHVHVVWATGGYFVAQGRLRVIWERLVGYGFVHIEAVSSGEGAIRYVVKNVGGYVSQQQSTRRLESKGWRGRAGTGSPIGS